MPDMAEPLRLPPTAAAPEATPFPVAGVLAPLAVAAVLFAITRSSAVLLFAAFSPVFAVGSVVDGALQRRRTRRRAAAARAGDLAELEREVVERLAARTAALVRAMPPPSVEVRRGDDVVLGVGDVPVEPLVSGRPRDQRERALVALSAVLPSAPITVPAGTPIVVIGPPLLADAFGRAVAAQTGVPPRIVSGGEAPQVDGVCVELVAADTARVLRATGPAASLAGLGFRPELRSGASEVRDRGAVPGLQSLAAESGGAGVRAAFAVDEHGAPSPVDLVADGPHAVVGGTTGSGKSVLLTAWLLAMAMAHPPERLSMVLLDCKGGAAFDPLLPLPHVVGVVTDLELATIDRVVRGLRAELRRREQLLRAEGVPSIERSGQGRLVVVVDEYRALIERAPDAAAVFADIAARGRSLGVHLVLCTQRPVGQVRDELLANCALRISLRVNDRADSTALVGTDRAARLPRSAPGTAVVADADGSRLIRVAAPLTDDTLVAVVAQIAGRHPDAAPRRPWRDRPLDRIPLGTVAAAAPPGAVALGLLDLPDEQRQPRLDWDPVLHPRLLVLGGSGSGRSTALGVISAQCGGEVLSSDPATAWDELHTAAPLLLIDDLDALLASFTLSHAQAAADLIAARMRVGLPTVLAARGPSAWAGIPMRQLAAFADRTLLLRLSADDHAAAGGVRALWHDRARPGDGEWHGTACRVAFPPSPASPSPASPSRPIGDSPFLLVSARPGARVRQLRAAGLDAAGLPASGEHAAAVVVASVAEWQGAWSERARFTGPVALDGLSEAETRLITGRSELAPPLSHPDDVVVVPAEGSLQRARLPRATAPL